MGLIDRFQHAWNAFMGRDPTRRYDIGPSSYRYPGRARMTHGHDRSMVTGPINRIAVDVASIDVNHVRLDENGRYVDTIPSYLNECLTVEANIDQTARDFKLDVVYTMLDEGTVAIDSEVEAFISHGDIQTNGVIRIRVANDDTILSINHLVVVLVHEDHVAGTEIVLVNTIGIKDV